MAGTVRRRGFGGVILDRPHSPPKGIIIAAASPDLPHDPPTDRSADPPAVLPPDRSPPQTPAPVGLRLRGVRAGYLHGKPPAIESIDLDLRPGEILTVLGNSGSGKTSLLLAIAGLMPWCEGELSFGDRRLDALPPHRRGVSMMLQGSSLYPHQTLGQNVHTSRPGRWGKTLPSFLRRRQSVCDATIGRRVAEYCSTAGLDGLLDRMPDEVSGGQRRRAALVRCMASGHPIRLIDEPFSALDGPLATEMVRWIDRWHRDTQGCTVCVTHDFRRALMLGHRLAVVGDGRLLQIGDGDALASDPVRIEVARICTLSPLQEVPVGAFCNLSDPPSSAVTAAFAASDLYPGSAGGGSWYELRADRSRPLAMSHTMLDVVVGDQARSVLSEHGDPGNSPGHEDCRVTHWRVRRERVKFFDAGGDVVSSP